MTADEPILDADQLRQRARRKLALIAAAFLGAFFAVTCVVVYYLLQPRDSSPKITRDDLDAAQAKWNELKPDNYEMEIRVTGPQAATYAVQVRDGTVVSLSHNDTQLTRRRGFHTWSVSGMFGTIGRDVERVEAVEAGTAQAGASRLELRGRFHPRLGYPQHYYRYEWDSHIEVTWDVTNFEIVGH